MPSADLNLPPSSTQFGEPPVDVSVLYQPTTAYTVVSLGQEERIRPRDGKVIPTIAVSFTVPGHPGIFTIRIDNYAFTHADPVAYMNERAYLIRSLYALPAQLPPYVPLGGFATGVILSLDAATATTDGTHSIQWAGTVWDRNEQSSVTVEATPLGGIEAVLASDPIIVPPSDSIVPLSGILGPLDPGKYWVQLLAQSSLGIGLSAQRAVTVL